MKLNLIDISPFNQNIEVNIDKIINKFKIYLNNIEFEYANCPLYNHNNLLTTKQQLSKDIKELNFLYNNIDSSIEDEIEDEKLIYL